MSLWFVTPAWQRYEMTALCLEQRRRVIDALAGHGVEAHQVVVADDENLDIARSVGAATVETANFDAAGKPRVGGKFNDGMEYAGKAGAEWIVPIGSDSWIDIAYFLPLPNSDRTLTSEAYCAVGPSSLARLWVSPRNLDHSAGPYVFHRDLLAPTGFRPAADDSGFTDSSTIAGIRRHRQITWQTRTVQPFQYVGFRVAPMMTSYHALTRRWLVREYPDPWTMLARHYPVDLVERARTVMETAA